MAGKLYNENGYKLGRVLATGRGWSEMMNVCARNNWSTDNSVLYVANTDDANSRWKIYAIEKAEKGAQGDD